MGTIIVSNAAQLQSALSAAKGGDTLVLKGGDYGKLSLINKAFDTPVKIVSESETNPAILTGLSLRNTTNLKFESIKFDYTSKYGQTLWESPFAVYDSKNIGITKSVFDGDVAKGVAAMDNGYGNGRGLFVTGTTGFELSNSKLSGFHRGVFVNKSNGLNFSGNEITDMSSDGLDLAEVTNVVISGNHIHDFHFSKESIAHPDFIQFMSPNAKIASSNIKITDNFLDQGTGNFTQSIFMKNEAVQNGAGKELFYKDVFIANNIIRNGHSHGITVGDADGVTIQNNTVLANILAPIASIPSINVFSSSTGVSVTNNLTNGITVLPKTGWTVSGNYIVQNNNPSGKDYIGKIFADPLDKDGATLNDFKFIPGNEAEQLGVGSTLSKHVGGVSGLILNSENNTINSLDQKFDASYVIASGGKVNLAGAKITWDYGDGKSGEGLLANHTYDHAGTYTASVKIILASGQTVTADKTFVIKNAAILDMDFDNGPVDNTMISNAVNMGAKAQVVTMSDGNKVLDLNGGYVAIKTDSEFLNNSKYTFVADFKKDAGAEGKMGRLAYFGGSLIVTVTGDGLEAIVNTSKGLKILKADHLGIKDTDWHRVGVTFSGETGYAKLFLDGKEVGSIGGLEGAFQQGYKGAGFNLGGLYGLSFDGKIDNVNMFGESMPASALALGGSFMSHVNAGNAASAAKMAAAASLIEDSHLDTFVAATSSSPTATVEHVAESSADHGFSLPSVNHIQLDSDFRLI
jgi:hypothetical protein